MRTIDADSLKELFSQETAYVWLPAVSFMTGTPGESLHLVANTEPVSVNEVTYTPCPFEFALPNDEEESPPQISMTVDAVGPVGRHLIKTLQTLQVLTASIQLLRGRQVAGSWEWQPELVQDNWNILNASVSSQSISLTLGYRMNLLNEPATVGRFIPAVAPGLFR